jgi:hypothetical protein
MRKLFIAVLSAAMALTAGAQERTGQLITLKNGDVTMTIDVEKGGKILSFKHQDKEVLSQSKWPESFGSTFWTSPQKEWNWPPVAAFDKAAYTLVQQGDNRFVIKSPVAERLGMSVTKDFSVEAPSATVGGAAPFLVTYTIKNEGRAPRKVAPWEISRVKNEDGIIFFEAPVDSIWPKGLMNFEAAYGAAWYKTDEAPQNRKVNADGKGWLAYCANGLLLVKKFQDLQIEEPAPGEAEVQVYVNRGKSYIELESQGAYTLLQPGEELHWTVRWYLVPVEADANPSAELLKLVE